MGKINFTSYTQTINYSKSMDFGEVNTLKFYGASLWERKAAWDYMKNKSGITKYKFSEFSGTEKSDLFYIKDKERRLVEIKFRYVKSTDYPSMMCERGKYHQLIDLALEHNAFAEYWCIFLDGVIQIYDLRYAKVTQSNVERDASDSYNTQNKKNYPTYFLTQDNLYSKKFRDTITLDEINNFASKELRKRGYNVPNDFKITKK